MTLIALLIVTLFDKMSGLAWTRESVWHAVEAGSLPCLCGLYLKYSEAFKRTTGSRTLQRERRTKRQLITGKAMRKMCSAEIANNLKDIDRSAVREAMLESAALGIEELLGFDRETEVTAHLVVFVAEDLKQMRVVCRSRKEREGETVLSTEKFVAWDAIRDGKIANVDDTERDYRWRDNTRKRAYRSVAAVPITIGGRSPGAISIDCSLPYAFYAKLSDIAIQLEPYAAVLALTFNEDDYYTPCSYEPSNHP